MTSHINGHRAIKHSIKAVSLYSINLIDTRLLYLDYQMLMSGAAPYYL